VIRCSAYALGLVSQKSGHFCTSIDLFGWHHPLDHQYPQREAFLAGPEYQCGGLGANVAASLTAFCSHTSVVSRLRFSRKTSGGVHGALVVGMWIVRDGDRGTFLLRPRRARLCPVRWLS
jgi:hypothetical protein